MVSVNVCLRQDDHDADMGVHEFVSVPISGDAITVYRNGEFHRFSVTGVAHGARNREEGPQSGPYYTVIVARP